MMCNAEDDGWNRFLKILKTNILPDETSPIGKGVVNTNSLSVRTGNGTYFRKMKVLNIGTTIDIYESVGTWYRIGAEQWVAKRFVTAQPITEEKTRLGKVNVTRLNIRSGPSTFFNRIRSLTLGDTVTIYAEEGSWYHIGNNEWVYKNFIDIKQEVIRQGFVIASKLNMRKGAGTNQPVVGSVSKNDVVSIFEEKNGWLRIGDQKWVYGIYITEKQQRKGKVNANTLNVRSGPGTSFSRVKSLTRHTHLSIEAQEGKWLRIATGQWVHGDYIIEEEM